MTRSAFAVLAILSLLSAGAEPVCAEMTDHHGFTVELHASVEDCVVCHDGSIAKNVVYCLKDCSIMTPHAVKHRYPPPGREAAYRPVASLQEAGIELVDGMVACVSCHNLTNQSPYHLAVGIAASGLCLTCHIQ